MEGILQNSALRAALQTPYGWQSPGTFTYYSHLSDAEPFHINLSSPPVPPTGLGQDAQVGEQLSPVAVW